MSGSRKHAVPAWMLSTAATAGLFLAPALLQAQTRSSQPAQATAAAPAAGESSVQQELRRLYAESGREMPEVPANVQMQAQAITETNPSTPGAAPRTIAAPPPSAPAKTNPVVAFLKKLIPGSQPSQKTASASNTPPKPSAPTALPPKPAPPTPRYAPYASQPPRRLPAMESVAAVPQPHAVVPNAAPAPQPPLIVPAPQPATLVTPPVTLTSPSITAPAQLRSPNVEPVPTSGPVLAANDAASDKPSLEPIESEPQDAPLEEFPDPFTEVSESEADTQRTATAASPFTDAMPEELATDEQSPAGEPSVEAPALSVPEARVIAAPDAPVLPALPDESQPPLELPPESTAKSAPIATPEANPPRTDAATEAKMAKIRERGGMKGLKGFCPVTLRDQRELLDARPEFQASFRGQKFHFASEEAKAKFEADPTRYAPAAYGADIVVLIRDKDVAEGTLDYAAWFKGRLFLFASEETCNTFLADPAKYGAAAGLE